MTVFEPMDQASIAQYSPDHTPRFFCANMPFDADFSRAAGQPEMLLSELGKVVTARNNL